MAKRSFKYSDIPYADRMLLQKFNTIAEHRNDAARTALKISCVALNNTKAMGYFQLVRFAEEQQRLTDEYYANPEVEEKHLNDRLKQIGFVTKDGRLLGAVDADGKPVKASDLPEDDVLEKAGGAEYRQLWTGWNSVKDKLPKDRSDVLVTVFWHEAWQTALGWYDGHGNWYVQTRSAEKILPVTYWMPLPEPLAE